MNVIVIFNITSHYSDIKRILIESIIFNCNIYIKPVIENINYINFNKKCGEIVTKFAVIIARSKIHNIRGSRPRVIKFMLFNKNISIEIEC